MTARELLLDRAKAVLERWRTDPVQMVVDEWPQVELDTFQVEALRAFGRPDIPRIAMKSCKGPGKTFVLAMCGLNFMATRPGEVQIGATSITGDNLDSCLWPELLKWIQRSEFFRTALVWSKSAVVDARRPGERFLLRRTWPKKGNAEEQTNALAGVHGEHVMWLIDEVGSMPVAVMETAEAIFSTKGQEAKMVIAGNPTDPGGALYHVCTRDRKNWYVITITNDPDSPKRAQRGDLEYAKREIERWGRENPWVKVNVLGEFPDVAFNTLLGIEDVEAAMTRHIHPGSFEHVQKRLGVDVARFGSDKTTIFPRQGDASFPPVDMRHQRTDEIAARILMAETRWRRGDEDILTLVDNTYHWGNGVIDQLIAAGRAPIGVNYAGKAIDPRFKNRRAEMYIKGAERIKKGACLPYIKEMIEELVQVTYTLVGGQFILEDKDQLKERIGRSPDYADAYMTTYALEDIPTGVIERLRNTHKAKIDFDPYATADRNEPGRAEMDFDPYDPQL